jgi:hypothetical protein
VSILVLLHVVKCLLHGLNEFSLHGDELLQWWVAVVGVVGPIITLVAPCVYHLIDF